MDYLQPFSYLDFSNNKAIGKRFLKILLTLASAPLASILRAFRDKHQAKAAYRFLANKRVTEEAIIGIHREATLERIRNSGESVVLVPQNTTKFNYTNLKKTTELGTIGINKEARGLVMHSAIAVTTQGAVLGLLDQNIWERPEEEYGKKHSRHKRPFKERESYNWLKTARNSESGDHGNARMVHVCDREGDIYEFFHEASVNGWLFLSRRIHDRQVGGQDTISSFLRKQEAAGIQEVEVCPTGLAYRAQGAQSGSGGEVWESRRRTTQNAESQRVSRTRDTHECNLGKRD